MLVCCVMSAMAVGHEYRYASARTLVALIPHRGAIAFSKVVTVAVTAGVGSLGTLTVGLASLAATGGAVVGRVGAPWLGAVALRLALSILSVVGISLLAMALTGLSRSLVVGIALPLVVATIVEPVLTVVFVHYPMVLGVFPFTAAHRVMGEKVGLGASKGIGALASLGIVWLYAAFVSGRAWLRFRESDVQ